MSKQPSGPFLFDPLPDEPEDEREEGQPSAQDEPRLSPTEEPSELVLETQSRGETHDGGTGRELRPPLDPSLANVASGPAVDPAAGMPGRRPQQVLFEEPGEDGGGDEVGAAALPGSQQPLRRVGPLSRLTAGLIDLAALLAVALVALLGARLLGVEPTLGLLPGVVLFVTVFSFAYHVFPLLFWGRTPGMALADLVTRDPTGQSLTAWQSTLRWAGSLGTVLFAGIPMVVSWFTGWSLADLVSGSETKFDPTDSPPPTA